MAKKKKKNSVQKKPSEAAKIIEKVEKDKFNVSPQWKENDIVRALFSEMPAVEDTGSETEDISTTEEITKATTPEFDNFDDRDMLTKAIDLAEKMHRDQIDKAGKAYFEHLNRVSAQMNSPTLKTVAYLHDILEDTDMTKEDLLAAGFPEGIVYIVELLTRGKGEDYFEYISRVAKDPMAREVKMADLRDNMQLERLNDITEKDINRTVKYVNALIVLENTMASS